MEMNPLTVVHRLTTGSAIVAVTILDYLEGCADSEYTTTADLVWAVHRAAPIPC